MKSNYIGPMPYSYFPHDMRWIGEQLDKLPPSLRGQVALKYSDAYDMAIERNKGRIEAETNARSECNTRLRKAVELYAAGGLAKTHSLEGVYKQGA